MDILHELPILKSTVLPQVNAKQIEKNKCVNDLSKVSKHCFTTSELVVLHIIKFEVA